LHSDELSKRILKRKTQINKESIYLFSSFKFVNKLVQKKNPPKEEEEEGILYCSWLCRVPFPSKLHLGSSQSQRRRCNQWHRRRANNHLLFVPGFRQEN
jgi:hypothetical protein